MADQQIINWIKENLLKGYSLDQLKDALLKQGHSDADIQEAISSLEKSPENRPEKLPSNAAEKPEKKKSKKWKIMGISLAAIILLIIILATQCNQSPSEVLAPNKELASPYGERYAGTFTYEYPAPESEQEMCGFVYCNGTQKMLNGSFGLTIDLKAEYTSGSATAYFNITRVISSEPLFETGLNGVVPISNERIKSHVDLPLIIPSVGYSNMGDQIYISFPNGKFLETSEVYVNDDASILTSSPDETQLWRTNVFEENETVQQYHALGWNLTKVY